MKKVVARLFVALGCVLGGAVIIAATLHSQTTAQSAPGQAIQVSPVLAELGVRPGQTTDYSITVTNVSPSNLVLTPEVNDFVAKDETGVPQILLKDESVDRSYSLRSWIQAGEPFELASNQSKSVKVNVTVPENAEPGGHYAVVRFSGSAPELSGSGVSLSASVGTLTLARVEGEITEALKIEELYIQKKGSRQSITESTPFNLVQRIRNEGNVHLKPKGDLTIKNMFGAIVGTVPVNEESGNILPESVRRFEQEYNGGFMLGRYTMEVVLNYGTKGQVLQGTGHFWVIPYKLIALILLIIVVVITGVVYGLRSYKKRILRQINRSGKK